MVRSAMPAFVFILLVFLLILVLAATIVVVSGPASLAIVGLLDKKPRRTAEVPIAYKGFEIPDLFVVGYGMDIGEKYRNLPYIAALQTAAE